MDSLIMQPDFALRLGETVVNGWKLGYLERKNLSADSNTLEARSLIPDISQKGVDLRMGMDIALLALRQLVDTIVVVTGERVI